MQRKKDSYLRHMDWLLLFAVAFLCAFGLVAIASATCEPYSEEGLTGLAGIVSRLNPYYVRLQLIWMGTGLVLAVAAACFDYKLYNTFAIYIYAVGLLLLVVVLFMPEGRGGVKNSIPITSTLSFQPGELVKLAYIVMMAKLLSVRDAPVKKVRELLPFLVYTVIPVGLIVAQGEVGTALVFLAIFAGMMFLAGTDWKLLVGLGLTGAVALVPIWFSLSEFRKERILNFLDPTRDLSNSGLNVYKAKMAAGSGRLWGKGLFQEGALSQLDYVPEKHTDFIFSVTAEAIGLVGSIALVALFVFVLVRMLKIARTARDSFGSMLCIGIASMIFFHVTENVCMNIGLLPVTGIPLPFLSYGGAATWTNLIAVGLVLSVAMRRKPGYL